MAKITPVPIKFQDLDGQNYFFLDETGDQTFAKYRSKPVREHGIVVGYKKVFDGFQKIYRDNGDGILGKGDVYVKQRYGSQEYYKMLDGFRIPFYYTADGTCGPFYQIPDDMSVPMLTEHVLRMKRAKELNDEVKSNVNFDDPKVRALEKIFWQDRLHTYGINNSLAEARIIHYMSIGIPKTLRTALQQEATQIVTTGVTNDDVSRFYNILDRLVWLLPRTLEDHDNPRFSATKAIGGQAAVDALLKRNHEYNTQQAK